MEAVIYGLVAEFAESNQILEAAGLAREAGYKRMDAYTPFPVHGLAEAIGFKDIWVPWIIFASGLAGACIGFGLQAYTTVVDNPWIVGGRPLLSWPSYVPVTFETTVLLAAFGAVFGMFALNGLPRPYHSIFNAPNFERATRDRFFLCIEADDPKFDATETRRFLEGLGAENVAEVEE